MRPIPPSVQSEICRKYLEGDSIPAISKLFNVSVGAVSGIVNELSKKDDYFIVIREVTKMFKNNNLEISDVISGIRLKNQVEEIGLTISFFENFLEATNTESFRLNKDHSEFLEKIKRILKLEELVGIKLENIHGYIFKQIKNLKNLKEENKKLIEKNTSLYSQYKIEKSEIEEYVKEKLLFLQYKRDKDSYPKYRDWIVFSPHLFEEASKKIGIKIEAQSLYEKLNRVYLFPNRYTSILKKIMSIDENDWTFITKK
jgi:hypothetical protein